MNVTVTFANQTTSTTWTLVIYLTLPGQSFDSVCWKQTTAPPSGSGGPLSWCTEDLNAAIGCYHTTDMIYTTRQARLAKPGSMWKIVADGDAAQLQANGSAMLPTQIQILNDTGQMANPGLGVDGTGALFSRDLLSGVSAVFDGVPEYRVVVCDTAVPGQLITTSAISANVALATTELIAPMLLDFSQGTTATVSISQVGETPRLAVTY
jgi:rhizosphere induced protein